MVTLPRTGLDQCEELLRFVALQHVSSIALVSAKRALKFVFQQQSGRYPLP